MILKFITKTEHKAPPKNFMHFGAISAQRIHLFFLVLAGA